MSDQIKPGRFVTISTSSSALSDFGDANTVISAIDVHGNLWHKFVNTNNASKVGSAPWILDEGNVEEPSKKPEPHQPYEPTREVKSGIIDKLFGI